MSITQSLLNDSRAIWHLVAARSRGATHQERLNHFYGGQADIYDSFRKRMLHGRQEMVDSISVQPNSVWVDLGCGTGENLERFGERLSQFSHVHLVDLCEPLLNVARKRSGKLRGETSVQIHEADAATLDLPSGQADLVTLSYSLSMIPDWFAVIDNAYRMLRPGGMIGVVDFFVSRKHVDQGDVCHSWLTRTGWPIWFGFDNVDLGPDRLAMLTRRFAKVSLSKHRGHIAYIPLLRVPYFVFVGRKE